MAVQEMVAESNDNADDVDATRERFRIIEYSKIMSGKKNIEYKRKKIGCVFGDIDRDKHPFTSLSGILPVFFLLIDSIMAPSRTSKATRKSHRPDGGGGQSGTPGVQKIKSSLRQTRRLLAKVCNLMHIAQHFFHSDFLGQPSSGCTRHDRASAKGLGGGTCRGRANQKGTSAGNALPRREVLR